MDQRQNEMIVRTATLVEELHDKFEKVPERLAVIEKTQIDFKKSFESHETKDEERFEVVTSKIDTISTWGFRAMLLVAVALGAVFGFEGTMDIISETFASN